MTNTTLLSNLINPKVMGDMIGYELENKLKATQLFKVDKTLTGKPGDTITIPSYLYIGEAEELAENAEGTISDLNTVDVSYTIKKAVKNVQLTDEAVLSGYGDPVGETNKQLRMSIQDKMENDAIKLLDNITTGSGKLTLDASTKTLSYDVVVDAIDLLNLEDEGTELYLIVSKQGIASLRKDPKFVDRFTAFGDSVLTTGVIGAVAGAKVMISNRILATDATVKAFLVKPNPFTAFMKRDITLETERQMLFKRTIIGSDCHYIVAIEDYTKVVSITHKKA